MKLLLCGLLLMVIFCNLSITSACDLDALCQKYELVTPYIAHPGNCSKSFKCKNGESLVFNCPNGQLFSEELQKCVESGDSICNASSNKLCSQKEYSTTACDPTTICREYELLMPFIAHPGDCTKSYKCRNGKAVVYNCPNGKEFSDELQQCVEAGQSTCTVTCT